MFHKNVVKKLATNANFQTRNAMVQTFVFRKETHSGSHVEANFRCNIIALCAGSSCHRRTELHKPNL